MYLGHPQRITRRLSRGGAGQTAGGPGQTAGRGPEKHKIGFVGATPGAGATTLALAAAEYLAAAKKARGLSPAFKKEAGRLIAYVEADAGGHAAYGCPYDKIGADRHFAGRAFLSFYRLAAAGKPVSGVFNISGGINWALRVPGEQDIGLSAAGLIRLIDNITGSPVLCDITCPDKDILADMNRIVCVVDPLPSRLLAGAKTIELVRAAEAGGVPVTWVLNKMNKGVNRREVLRFLPVKTPVLLPAVPAESLYAAEFACRSLASDPDFQKSLSEIL
ncbi:MAG: hypothetical protein LBS85_04450 [Clostridiales Family XIII bacterium]|jgi:hypothetical protein|nr:hypothetical protein [Clostridiales Family XIII bacterium]